MTMAIWGSSRHHTLLRFGHRDWEGMVRELGRRGGGHREAGAFLMARRGGDRRHVVRAVYLDDLDPHCLQGNHIHFHGRAYSKLWDICDSDRLVVVGDVHTHGGDWVEQSPIDGDHRILCVDGHVALILPHLATRHLLPRNVGVHRYGGSAGWESWSGDDARRRLHIRRLR